MNLSNRLLLPMLVATLSTAVPAIAAPNLEEGNYEVTMKMEMEGMPFAMPPVKHNQCMTKKDMVPDTSRKGEECTIKDQKVVGDTLTWRIECNGKDGKTEGDGKITYAGKSYDGLMKMKMMQKGETMNMKMAFQGKHTGACKSPPGKKAGDY